MKIFVGKSQRWIQKSLSAGPRAVVSVLPCITDALIVFSLPETFFRQSCAFCSQGIIS